MMYFDIEIEKRQLINNLSKRKIDTFKHSLRHEIKKFVPCGLRRAV